jgi:hypothetical protein
VASQPGDGQLAVRAPSVWHLLGQTLRGRSTPRKVAGPEEAFAKLKALLSEAWARTHEALIEALIEAMG